MSSCCPEILNDHVKELMHFCKNIAYVQNVTHWLENCLFIYLFIYGCNRGRKILEWSKARYCYLYIIPTHCLHLLSPLFRSTYLKCCLPSFRNQLWQFPNITLCTLCPCFKWHPILFRLPNVYHFTHTNTLRSNWKSHEICAI